MSKRTLLKSWVMRKELLMLKRNLRTRGAYYITCIATLMSGAKIALIQTIMPFPQKRILFALKIWVYLSIVFFGLNFYLFIGLS